ncbi:ATPase (plasmid) [Haloterrigena turkmenica DSM 5511]|uniref:ATPase n=1 Tax=Haloterrigena turkmenica (strain ATCC 51198 / DSM 5511 / JCM 9101 / NCIMB 13204 / VKM B-1734 / 4k) TaxID=543526 RepID=D2S2I0_HALTV|nr:ATP-binding protein [Haloterrigena turkmenica]ADB63577.1 ATPase [Haloterrigena turkmenica DSM 5511]
MDRFIDRQTELSRFRDCYGSDEAGMVVIFGRRRLGKTELVRQSLTDRDDAVFYQATETTSQVQLDEFVDVASESFPSVDRIKGEWESLLGYLAEQDTVVVLDEFPYLIDADESLPSVIQRLWDQEIQDTAATLVLVGSSISMMEEATLLGNSPLYGRFTEKIDLRQLDFDAACEFFPDSYTPEEQMFAWGVFGGTPYYLDGVELDHDLGTVIQRSILSQQGFLHNEPEYVLRTELTEPNRYFAILKAIAAGNTTANEIAGTVGIDGKQISTYAQKLERLRLVEREVPITEDKTKSRRGRYRIVDPLFRFWFRFVYGNEDRYERLSDDAYETVIEPEMADFVSQEFERLCQDALPELYPAETFVDIGRWWYKEHEVDVVGLTDDGTMVAGECKFTSSPLDYGALASLEDHADEIRWAPNSGDVERKYVLFARSGFTQSVREAAAERDDLELVDLAEIIENV